MKQLFYLLLFSCFLNSCRQDESLNNNQQNQDSEQLYRVNFSEASSTEFFELEYENGKITKEWIFYGDTSWRANIKNYDSQDRISEQYEDKGDGTLNAYKYQYLSDDTLKISYYKNEISSSSYQYSMYFVGTDNLPDTCYSIDKTPSVNESYLWENNNLLSQTTYWKNFENKNCKTVISYTYSTFLNPLRGIHTISGMESTIHHGQEFNYFASQNLFDSRIYHNYKENILVATDVDNFSIKETNNKVTQFGIDGNFTLNFLYQ